MRASWHLIDSSEMFGNSDTTTDAANAAQPKDNKKVKTEAA